MSKTIVKLSKLLIDQMSSAPIIFVFKDDDDAIQGRLEVYKRSLTWYSKNSKRGRTLRVGQLDEAFQKGRKRRTRK